MTDLSALRAKLRALKAKTPENGCTEEEAMRAAEKVAELLARHGLTEEQLQADDYDETEILIGRRSPLTPVWHAVANFADCKGWFVQKPDGMHYVYFGRAGDVLVAEYVHGVMADACKRAVAEFRRTETYTRRRTRRTRSQAVRAFQEAMAATLRRKLVEGLWRRYRASGSPEAAGHALVVRNRDLDAQAQAAGHRFQAMKALARAEGKFRDDAHRSGFRAGAAIEVNASVAAGNKVSGVLA